jgi:hypothetical protein
LSKEKHEKLKLKIQKLISKMMEGDDELTPTKDKEESFFDKIPTKQTNRKVLFFKNIKKNERKKKK